MDAAHDKYQRLALRGAWRRFEISGGGRTGDLEKRLRALEEKVGDLNLERDTVHLAAELAALEGNLDADARFALIVLTIVTLAALAQGSTRFPVTGEISRKPMHQMLGALVGTDPAAGEKVRRSIEDLLLNRRVPKVVGGTELDQTPLLFLEPFISHARSRALERRLVDSITARRKRAEPFEAAHIEHALRDVIERPAFAGAARIELSTEQLSAVRTAVGSPLALISGGPGTGKTSIVVAILRVLARLKVPPREITLAAPTGRAAFRLRDAVTTSLLRIATPSAEDGQLLAATLDAVTVHRLLGYSPDRGIFLHHHNNPIAARAVIVDEASMLDLAMMERLVGAVAAEAQLVFLGDVDQLPSVSAGAAFRDLVPLDRLHPLSDLSVRLTRNYRTPGISATGSAIVEVCRRINAGDLTLASEPDSGGRHVPQVRSTVDEIQFNGVELLPTPTGGLDEFLDRWEGEQVAGDAEINSLVNREYAISNKTISNQDRTSLTQLGNYRARTRILCVTRLGPCGSDAVNARMHRRVLHKTAGRTIRAAPMVAGDPVIVVRNDYDRSLFNGDQGVVVNALDVDGKYYAGVVFVRGTDFAVFRLDMLGDLLELGYATTVHKAQGSEFDIAAVMLPDRDLPVLTRELLYTAVSRCRRGVVIVGDTGLLRAGIARKADRYSGVAAELAARFSPAVPQQLELALAATRSRDR
ncbi:MAG TPA: AAA family ATPase [Candidatus Binataceae bacterium]|nr:AAA family ATPase [Candidatus Binataceae bacterium]